MAQYLQRQFTHLGHTVLVCASSAQEAIAHIQRHRPAVVLMDLHLPGEIDGLAAAHAMQAIYNVRVIYYTGETSAQLTEHTEPPVLWYDDGEPMKLEALHRILARTMESGQRPRMPSVPMGWEQSAVIWRVPLVLLEGLEQVPQQARKAYQPTLCARQRHRGPGGSVLGPCGAAAGGAPCRDIERHAESLCAYQQRQLHRHRFRRHQSAGAG